MDADDPRHGQRSGYQAHRLDDEDPCGPCQLAHDRYCKMYRHRTRNFTVTLRSDADEALEIFDQANSMGISDYSFCRMAGVSTGFSTRLRAVRQAVNPKAMSQLREALVTLDVPDIGKINADLSQWRVRSMMRQSWALSWIGEQADWASGSRWMYAKRISAGRARRIRDIAAEVGDKTGPAFLTGAYATRQGWFPFAAWDDPGTITWPIAWPRPGTRNPNLDMFDEAAVIRRMAGEKTEDGEWVRLHGVAESVEVVRRLRFEHGMSLSEIELQTGLNANRYNQRARLAQAAQKGEAA